MSQWVKKLVTKDDPIHVHKTLGLAVLVSFGVRFAMFGESDMGFLTHPEWTLATLALHLLLNISAFEFHLPKKRIAAGDRIWNEYRAHSLVFASRTAACIFVAWMEQEYNLEPNYLYNYAIVIGAMLAADFSSWYYGGSQSTIRNLQVPNYYRFAFSYAQFIATTGCLFGLRRASAFFFGLFVVQGNAFNMTVRRKNLLTHKFVLKVYAVMLAIFAYINRYDLMYKGESAVKLVIFGSILACLIRMIPLPSVFKIIQNKYILWTGVAYMVHRLRPLVEGKEEDSPVTDEQFQYMYYAAVASISTFATYQTLHGYDAREKAKQAEKKVE